MLFQGIQQFHMILLGHFVSVLFSAFGFHQIRRISINQHIFKIEFSGLAFFSRLMMYRISASFFSFSIIPLLWAVRPTKGTYVISSPYICIIEVEIEGVTYREGGSVLEDDGN